jgi:hypothetical protein
VKLQELVQDCLSPGFHFISRPTFPDDVCLRVIRVQSLRPDLPHSYVPTSNKHYPRVVFEVWVRKSVVYQGWVPSLEDLAAVDWFLKSRNEEPSIELARASLFCG